MTIISVQYTDETQRSVQVTYDDGAILSVPVAAGNRHWTDVQSWLAAGNTIAPALAPTPTPPAVCSVVRGTTDSEKLANLLQALNDAGIIIHTA